MEDFTLTTVLPHEAGPKRADAIANRQLILKTAERLFDEFGIDAVTMSEVARAAGVGKGTLYRAFANKGELCIALMDEDLRSFQNEILAQFNEQHSATALDKLALFLEQTVRFFDRHVALMLAAQSFGMQLQARPEIGQTMIHGWFHQTVTLLVRQAQQEGMVSAESDPAYLADVILAPLNPTLFRHQRIAVGLTLETISDNLIEFVMNGIRVRDSSVSVVI